MSDLHDEDIEPEAEPGAAEATEDPGLELKRPDPRLRPPDPAGTQPKWDPDELLPKETPRAAAGRLWAPAAEDGTESDVETVPAGATATATATATAAAEPAQDDDVPAYSRYSARFQFLLGALLAIGAAAVALLVVVVAGDGKDDNTIVLRDGATWSSWRPTATGIDAAEQIAKHVGRQYRLPDGKQLVLAEGGAMEIAGLPVTIAIQKPVAQGGDIDLVDDGVGVMYRLCGFNADSISTDCKIVSGKPSTNRGMLLRREALELALYSFRYLGVSETVVLLPPTVDASPPSTATTTAAKRAGSTALLFRRNQPDVQRALARPLRATLAAETPSVSGVTRSPDATVVRDLTQTKAYRFKFQESNEDARAFLLLAPLGLR